MREEKMTKNTWVVPSETTPDKFYEITKVGDRFVCSCPDCLYREHDCKHIRKLKAKVEEEKKEGKK